MTRSAVAAVILFTLTFGCAPAPPADTREANAKAIRDLEATWSAAAGAKDADKFASYYADDAIVFAPFTAPMKGRIDILGGMKHMMADPNFNLSFTTANVDVARSGELAVSHGAYTLRMTDPATKRAMDDKGNYVTAWKRQTDGTWKAFLDINTSAMAMQTPTRAKGKTQGKAKTQAKGKRGRR